MSATLRCELLVELEGRISIGQPVAPVIILSSIENVMKFCESKPYVDTSGSKRIYHFVLSTGFLAHSAHERSVDASQSLRTQVTGRQKSHGKAGFVVLLKLLLSRRGASATVSSAACCCQRDGESACRLCGWLTQQSARLCPRLLQCVQNLFLPRTGWEALAFGRLELSRFR